MLKPGHGDTHGEADAAGDHGDRGKAPDEICEDLLSYLEDIDLYYDPELKERIRRSQEELARGDFVTLEQLEAEIG